MIYLDHAATTKPDKEVTEAMLPYLGKQFLNPSAFYQPAVRVRVKLDDARREIADFIHADPRAIYFTSGGTEADNWALRIAVTAMAGKGRHIISSPVEHPAVRNSLQYLRKLGFEISFTEISREGLVDVDQLKDMIREDTILISVMHANNEIGTIEPIEEIGKLAADRGILFHTDAVQTFGHIPIDLRKCHIDLLSASAHKLYGPKGVGLQRRRKNPLPRACGLWDPHGGIPEDPAVQPGPGDEGGGPELHREGASFDHSWGVRVNRAPDRKRTLPGRP